MPFVFSACLSLLFAAVVADRVCEDDLRLKTDVVRGDVPCGSLEKKFGLKRGAIIGSYELDECLGAGSFGEVWRAKASRGGHDVAVKLAKGATDENGGKDWRRNDVQLELLKECIAAQQLTAREQNHAQTLHFVDCLEIGLAQVPTGQHVPFLTMPLIGGRNVEKAFMESGKGPIKEFPNRSDALKALQRLIEASKLQVGAMPVLLHMDMQPSNLIVHNGQLMVLDYGEMHFCCGERCTMKLRSDSVIGEFQSSYEAQACDDSLSRALRDALQLVYFDALMLLCPWSGGPAPLDPVYGFAWGRGGELQKAVCHNLRTGYECAGMDALLSELPKLLIEASTLEVALEAANKALSNVFDAIANLLQ